MPVTDQGYVLKTQNEVQGELKTDLTAVVDPVSSSTLSVDFTAASPMSQQFQIIATAISINNEQNQLSYNQFNLYAATGPILSSTVKLNGLTANPATQSQVDLNFTGTPLSVVAAGVLVTDQNNTNTWTAEGFTFDGAGNVTNVSAICETFGAIDATPNTLNTIVTAPGTVTTVTNPFSAVTGENAETPTALRVRQSESTLAPAIGVAGSISANLENLAGVVSVREFNNPLPISDQGVPAKTLAVIIDGGEDQAIAQVIISRRSSGADTFGSTTVNYLDHNGEPNSVSFSRPTPIDIFVSVDISIEFPSVYPDDAVDQIKDNIVEYGLNGATGLGVPPTNFNDFGYKPGDDVVISRLNTPILAVPGHKINTLFIGLAASPTGTIDIPISLFELATMDLSRIEVTVS